MIGVTGATGFVGRAVLAALRAQDQPARAFSREPLVGHIAVGSLASGTDWRPHLDGLASIIHLAARVHVMKESADDPLAEFRRDNVAATVSLARQAAAAGVKRFVFVSSVKVNGEETAPGHAFRPDDPPNPLDPYARTKLEAEMALTGVADETGLEVVIVRPPIVYGPGVKGNFRIMMRMLQQGVPLPLASVKNRRSLVSVDNLADLLIRCASHPAAAGRTLLVSDGEDLSTPELLRRLGAALGRPARLLPVSPALMTLAASAVGKGAVARRLLGSLRIDARETRQLLGWTPPQSVDVALQRAAKAFLAENRA